MASVRNQSEPVAQTESNVVLFQMMMHYKRRMEDAEESAKKVVKKMRTNETAYLRTLELMEHDSREADNRIRFLVAANVQGANALIRKHEAGMRLIHCLDDVFNAVELVDETQLAGENNLGLRYINSEKKVVGQRARVAIDLLMRDPEFETHEFHTEVIDLTADEETEEESEGEIEI